MAFFYFYVLDLLQRFINWRAFFVLVAIAISVYSMYYANDLSNRLAKEESKKVEIVAKALEISGKNALALGSDSIPISCASDVLLDQVISNNTTVPLIITDENNEVLGDINLPALDEENNSVIREKKLLQELEIYQKKKQRISVILNDSTKQYVYYGESSLTKNLRLFPYGVLGVLFLFVILLIYFLNNSNKYIQDKVWVGMSKETAHQLGTPLTSLLGWLQLLKDKGGNEEIAHEMENDVARLQTIAERFSKIGSQPTLQVENIEEVLSNIVNYMRLRAPKKVTVALYKNYESKKPIEMSKPLFEWVIENLIRNAIDSLQGEGEITLRLSESENRATIDVSDTGKGIPKGKWETVFKPGFSTKKRGWGLGLSLSRRIIKEYHRGDIYVKNSEVDIGTTFRIELNKI